MDWSGSECCIKGCSNPVLAAGLCNKHWRRNKKYGSPVLLARPAASYRGMAAIDRFLPRANRSEGCWLWSSGKDHDGYGLFMGEVRGVVYRRAHRFAFAYYSGLDIPDGMNVCHSCDVPSCVNPAHLTLGTVAENQAEKWRKGRGRPNIGIKHPRAKLTEQQVREIRASTESQDEIAAKYGIKQTTVSDIKRRKSWDHLKD